MNIDFGYTDTKYNPLNRRNSIALLLGAGFSVPKGYPTANQLNKQFVEFDKFNTYFSTDGLLHKGETETLSNEYQKQFELCKKLIKLYKNKYPFDFEKFYDFLKERKEVLNIEYMEQCKDIVNEENYKSYIYYLPNIFLQMEAYLLHDKEGKLWYENEPCHIGSVELYDGFLKCIKSWEQKWIINVHTLNHDLLFESFNKTDYFANHISDGFDEYGSEYYCIKKINHQSCSIRLERYTGRYNTPIRLYKLHGSINYVPFYRHLKNSIFMIPDKYIKIKYGMSLMNLKRANKNKMSYEKYPFATQGDFLTGTKSKIKRYNEPLLFKKLFKNFKKNLKDAKKLIIIGYGCHDEEINRLITENFDYKAKPSYIVSPNPNEEVQLFAKKINAHVLDMGVEAIKEQTFLS